MRKEPGDQMHRRWGMRLAIAWFLALSLAGASGMDAGAHAALTGTDPVDGSVLTEPPPHLTLTFNERVDLNDEGLRLFDSTGTVTILEGSLVDTSILAILPDQLADGSYFLDWRVTSADDHPIAGVLSFAIGSESTDPVVAPDHSDDPWVARLLGIVQGVGYVGLLTTVGLLTFPLVVQGSAIRSLPQLAFVTDILTIITYLLALPLTVARQQGVDLGWSIFDGRRWGPDVGGELWLSTGLVAIGMSLAVDVVPRIPSLRQQRLIALLGLGAAVAAVSMLGHTRIYQPTWLIVSSNLLHTATGAMWFGGLLGLILFLRRAAQQTAGTAPNVTVAAVGTVVARFSVLAGILVGLLAVSGVVSWWIILGSFQELVSTDYGRLLLLKVGVAALACLVAAWNHYRLVPAIEAASDEHLGWSRLRRAVTVEASLLVGVLLITGFLVNQSPQQTTATDAVVPMIETTPIAFTATLGEGTVEGTIDPGTTGANHVMFQVLGADGLPIEPADNPEIHFSLPSADLGPISAVVVPMGEPGMFMATIDIPLGGEWEMEVIVRVSTFEEPIAHVSVIIP